MKILFIGGTKFVGRNLVELSLLLGHEVHILQRGKTNKDIFPETKKYFGDREQIEQLIPHNSLFDLVIDTCGYHPDCAIRSTI
jgi:2'-hydroxyisoflavone reductase